MCMLTYFTIFEVLSTHELCPWRHLPLTEDRCLHEAGEDLVARISRWSVPLDRPIHTSIILWVCVCVWGSVCEWERATWYLVDQSLHCILSGTEILWGRVYFLIPLLASPYISWVLYWWRPSGSLASLSERQSSTAVVPYLHRGSSGHSWSSQSQQIQLELGGK